MTYVYLTASKATTVTLHWGKYWTLCELSLYKFRDTFRMLNNTCGFTTNELKTDDLCVNLTSTNSQPETIVIINCTLNALLMLVSIIGNAMVLIAMLGTPSLRLPSTVFLCSLGVSDLLVGLAVQPVFIAHLLKPSVSILHAYSILSFFACGVSLGTMAAISVDRYQALNYHLRYADLVTVRRAVYVSTTIWVIALFLSCLQLWSENKHLFAIVVGIVVCILVSTFCYIKLYQIVRQHRRQIRAQRQAVDGFMSERNLNMVQSKKSAKNTFIYYICMILCYSPVFVSAFTKAIFPKHWTIAWTLTDTVAFMNSCINPFLYCWRVRELRKAVLKTLRNIIFKQTDGN